jgi:hypothetical protein
MQPFYLMPETDVVSETLCFLEHQTIFKVQKPSNIKYYTLQLEPFRIDFEWNL